MGIELLLPLLLLLPLVLITMRTRRQQREMGDLQQRLAPGQEVMTTSGAYGTVVSLVDDRVVLKVADGVEMTWARPAVARIITPPVEMPGTDVPGTPGDDRPGA